MPTARTFRKPIQAKPRCLFECTVKTRPLIAKALELGLVLAPSGENIIRLLPPLIIDERHITEALAKLDQLFSEIKT